MMIPAPSVKARRPHSAPMPRRIAPAAPAKPTCDSACPAKIRFRSTRKNPTAPPTIATALPAMKALRMNSYSSIVAMGFGFDHTLSGNDNDAVLYAQYIDGCSVEPGEHFRRDHLVHGTEGSVALAEVEHTIHGVEQRVELVGGEEHRHAFAMLNALHQRDDRLLEMRIETHEGLIQQKQLRAAEQRLRQEEPLHFTSRQLGQRSIGERGCLDHRHCALDVQRSVPTWESKA